MNVFLFHALPHILAGKKKHSYTAAQSKSGWCPTLRGTHHKCGLWSCWWQLGLLKARALLSSCRCLYSVEQEAPPPTRLPACTFQHISERRCTSVCTPCLRAYVCLHTARQTRRPPGQTRSTCSLPSRWQVFGCMLSSPGGLSQSQRRPAGYPRATTRCRAPHSKTLSL